MGKNKSRKSKEQRRQEAEQRRQEVEERQKQWRAELHLKRQLREEHYRQNPLPPPHPDSNISMPPDATLEITSGGLCYGMKHNCAFGASIDLVEDPAASVGAAMAPGNSTIAQQECCFNIKARNGQWNGYQLVTRKTPDSPISTVKSMYGEDFFQSLNMEKDQVIEYGWFACHSSLNPVDEIRRLFYHSASSIFTKPEHLEQGILCINRYDWGMWDLQGYVHKDGKEPKTPFPISGSEGEWDIKEVEAMEKDGFMLIDYAECKQDNWTKALSGIHQDCEYMYGRIGFEESQAKSFLFFGPPPDECKYYFKESSRPLGERISTFSFQSALPE